MRTRYKLLIVLLILFGLTGILLAVRTGDRKATKDTVQYESYSDISDSAVHGDLPVGMVLPTVKTMEVKPDGNSAGDSSDNADPDADDAGLNRGPDLYQMNVWELAAYMYGIDELTTTRMLKILTREQYPNDYLLNYYCACACVTRALYPENFGGNNIYQKFGELDESYDVWMDDIAIGDWTYEALRDALLDFHYVNQCNGMAVPWEYIYYSDMYGIYVWN